MNDNFKEGSWVFYNNRNHHYHLMMFQIKRIVPLQYDPQTGVTLQEQGYDLAYGSRSIFAKSDELIHRGDPKVQGLILGNPYLPEDKAFLMNPDGSVGAVINNIGGTFKDSHDGHEVVENYAGGKSFKYCRRCKVEVNE
jgi:hypothetical protein